MPDSELQQLKTVTCPKCGESLRVRSEDFAKRGQCNKCNHNFVPSHVKPTSPKVEGGQMSGFTPQSIPRWRLDTNYSEWLILIVLAATTYGLFYFFIYSSINSTGENTLSNVINTVFSGVTLGLMIVLYCISLRMPRQSVAMGNVINVLGIFGTFVGITVGLYFFDVANLQESIPSLLSGLKTAFVTSLAGILISTVMRGKRIYADQKISDEDAPVVGATIDTLANLLLEIKLSSEHRSDALMEAFEKQNQIRTESLEAIRNSICGDGETTLLTQFQKLRTSFNDKQDELIREFRDFAHTMAEQNTKAFIKALEDVIKDFNQKLTEQFGENFKQLNEAVGKLVVWQENYRQTLSDLEVRLQAQVEASERIALSHERIANQSDRLVTAADDLQALLEGLKTLRDDLNAHLRGVAELGERASNSFPQIENNIERLTRTFAESVNSSLERNESILEKQSDSMKSIAQGLANSIEGTMSRNQSALDKHSDSVNKILIQLDALTKSCEKAIKDATTGNTEMIREMTRSNMQAIGEHSDALHNAMRGHSEDLRRTLTETNENIRKQVEEVNRQLGEQLNQSLNSLGTSLASLSGQFVSDYGPLTEKLRQVVRLADESRR